jgi:hypothetical protein
METLRIRVTGSDTAANALINLVQGCDGVRRVEQVADDMPHMDDADSSSLGLPDDMGPGVHDIEIEASNAGAAEAVRERIDANADGLRATVEYVDEF